MGLGLALGLGLGLGFGVGLGLGSRLGLGHAVRTVEVDSFVPEAVRQCAAALPKEDRRGEGAYRDEQLHQHEEDLGGMHGAAPG